MTWSRRPWPRPLGQAGGASDGGTPPATPQFQYVIRLLCGVVAFESPGDHLEPGRERDARAPSCCGGSRSSRRAASPAARRRSASASSRPPCRSAAGRSCPAARSEASVEPASVDVLPTKVWSCDLPGWPGIDDRVVRQEVDELALADEVDARQHAPALRGRRAPAATRRRRSRDGDPGDERQPDDPEHEACCLPLHGFEPLSQNVVCAEDRPGTAGAGKTVVRSL